MVSGQAPPRAAYASFWECGSMERTDSIISDSDQTAPMGSSSASFKGVAATAAAPVGGVAGAQQRMRSIVDGLISPFMACVQPPLNSCIGGEVDGGVPVRDRWRPPIAALRTYRPNYAEPSAAPVMAGVPLAPSHSSSSSQCQPTTTQLIETPSEHDVLCGRGGSSNRHQGNLNFRELIAANKAFYATLTKKQKMLMARQIVQVIHNTDPPGRFLARDSKTGYFYNVGLPRSLEKTSQALREKTPSERAACNGTGGSDIHNDCDLDENESTPIDDDDAGCGEHYIRTTKSSSSSRNVQIPTLIVPPHLQSIYRIPHNSSSMMQQQQPMSPIPVQVTPYPINQSPYMPQRPPNMSTAMLYHSHTTPPPSSSYRFMPADYPGAQHTRRPIPSSSAHPILPSPMNNYPAGGQGGSVVTPQYSRYAAAAVDTHMGQVPTIPNCSSDEDQQDWKRRRSDPLPDAIHSRLSLEERVVAPPPSSTLSQQQHRSNRGEIMSPSSTLQSRQNSRVRGRGVNTSLNSSVDSMDGLAALSTAAFLRLDEAD